MNKGIKILSPLFFSEKFYKIMVCCNNTRNLNNKE